MTERYFINGAQIGTIIALIENGQTDKAKKVLDEIIDNQSIGNMQEPYSDYEIVIRKMKVD